MLFAVTLFDVSFWVVVVLSLGTGGLMRYDKFMADRANPPQSPASRRAAREVYRRRGQ